MLKIQQTQRLREGSSCGGGEDEIIVYLIFEKKLYLYIYREREKIL